VPSFIDIAETTIKINTIPLKHRQVASDLKITNYVGVAPVSLASIHLSHRINTRKQDVRYTL